MSRFLNWRGHAVLALPMRFYLAYVFIIACLHKIAHPEMFAVDVATYSILPLELINIMAISLPWIELVAGVMLVLGLRSRAAALMVVGMMIMFIVALLMALYQGLDMSCGCFASQAANNEDPISYKTVLRDLLWFALALWVVLFDANPIGLDRLIDKRRQHV
jgi:putative oxidoreductase